MTDIEQSKARLGADLRRCRSLGAISFSASIIDVDNVLTALADREAECERLRLAMLGGEDAPGYAASLPLEEVLRSFNALEVERRSRAELAEAKLKAIVEAAGPFVEDMEWIDVPHHTTGFVAPNEALVDNDDYTRPITYADIRRLKSAHDNALGNGEG